MQGLRAQLGFKARYGQPLYTCEVQRELQAAAPASTFQRSGHNRYSNLSLTGDSAAEQLRVTFKSPMRAITPGQVQTCTIADVLLLVAPSHTTSQWLMQRAPGTSLIAS